MTATDLVIVGGGPAGLATAIGARLRGFSVRLLERARPPLDKACGEGLMPDAVRRLAELGVEIPPARCCPFRGIRYLDGEVVAEGVFPGGGGLGVRRPELHRALAERAEQLGAELLWGEAALGLEPRDPRDPRAARLGEAAVCGVRSERGLLAARWVVGADGLHSRVRAWAGLEGAPLTRREDRLGAPLARRDLLGAPLARRLLGAPLMQRFGMRRHFAVQPWSDMVEVHWGPGCEAYVTPTGVAEVGVALLWSAERGKAGFGELLAHFPALGRRLAGAPAASTLRGCGPLRQRPAAVARGNVALVGDAAGYLDAITGEGIAVALHQSAALVAALAAGAPALTDGTPGALTDGVPRAPTDGVPRAPTDGAPLAARGRRAPLAEYAAAHARIGRLPDRMTALVLALERRPWLRRRAVRALAAEPALFSRLLGIHARALPPAGLGVDGALRLAYRLVTA